MAFPVDDLTTVDYESLEQSSKEYMSKLLYRNSDAPEYLTLPNSKKIEIGLCNVSFVPLHGTDVRHKILALFTLDDPFTAVGLYLQGKWWPVEEVLKTSDSSREGILKVRTVGERVVLYVLNRIVYRTTEMSKDEVPFLCHSENDFAKILWKNGEAIGFYSVKPEGSLCSSFLTQRYQLPVLDSMFVRKCHRGNGYGLQILEDFVDSFKNDCLGLKYPLSAAMYKVCGKFLRTYPADTGLLWEVESVGSPFQRTQIASKILEMGLKHQQSVDHDVPMEEVMTKMQETVEYTVEVVEKVVQIDTHVHITQEVEDTPVSARSRSSQLRRKRLREESSEVVEENPSEKVIRVEEIEAGTETPVDEPVSEEQDKDIDQDVEVGGVVSIVAETKLDQEDSDVKELTQASDVTATVIDKDSHKDIDTLMDVTTQLNDFPEHVPTVDTVLERPASEEAITPELNDREEDVQEGEYSTLKSPVEDVQREDEVVESSQVVSMSDVSQLTAVEDVKMTSEVDEEEDILSDKKPDTLESVEDEKHRTEEAHESVKESVSILQTETQTQISTEPGDSWAETALQKTQDVVESDEDAEDNTEESPTIEKRVLRKRTVITTETPRQKSQRVSNKAVEESTSDEKSEAAEEKMEEGKETAEETSEDEAPQTSQRVLRGRKTTAKATPRHKYSRRSKKNVAQTDSQQTTEAEEEADNEDDSQQAKAEENVEMESETAILVEEKDSGDHEELTETPTDTAEVESQVTAGELAEKKEEIQLDKALEPENIVEEDATAEINQETADKSAENKDEIQPEKDLEPEKTVKEDAASEVDGETPVIEKTKDGHDETKNAEEKTESREDAEQDGLKLKISPNETQAEIVQEEEMPEDESNGNVPTSGIDAKGATEDQTPETKEDKDADETENVTEQTEKDSEDVDITDAQVSQDEMGTTTQESSDHDLGTDDAGESPTIEKRVLRRRIVVSTETPRRKSQRVGKKTVEESTAAPSDKKPEAAEEKMEEGKETAEETSEDEAPQTSQRVLRGRKTTAKATPRHKYSRRTKKNVAQTNSQQTTEAEEEADNEDDSQQAKAEENVEMESETATLVEEKDSGDHEELTETPSDTAEVESQVKAGELAEKKEEIQLDKALEPENIVEEEATAEMNQKTVDKSAEDKDEIQPEKDLEPEKTVEEDAVSEMDGETPVIEETKDGQDETKNAEEKTESREDAEQEGMDLNISPNETQAETAQEVESPKDETNADLPTSGVDKKGATDEDQTPETEKDKNAVETENVTEQTKKQDEEVDITDAQVSQDEMGTTTQESSDHDLGTDDAGESPTIEKRVLRRRTVVSTETSRRKSQRVSKETVGESTAAPSDKKSEAAEEKMEEGKETAEETSEDEAPQTSQRVLRGRKTTAKATPRHKYSRWSKKNVAQTNSQQTTEAEEEADKEDDSQQAKAEENVEIPSETTTLVEEKDCEAVDTEPTNAQELTEEKTAPDATEFESLVTVDESAEDKDESQPLKVNETVENEAETDKVTEGDAMEEEEEEGETTEKQEDKQEITENIKETDDDVEQKGEGAMLEHATDNVKGEESPKDEKSAELKLNEDAKKTAVSSATEYQITDITTNTIPEEMEEDNSEAEGMLEEEKTTEETKSTEKIDTDEQMKGMVGMTEDEVPPVADNQTEDTENFKLQRVTVVLIDVNKVSSQPETQEESAATTSGVDEKVETGEEAMPQTEEDKDTTEDMDNTASQTDKNGEDVEVPDSLVSQDEVDTQESSDHDMTADKAEESSTIEKRLLRKRTVVTTETPRCKSQRVSKETVEESTAAPSDKKSEAAEEKMEEGKETAEETSEDEAQQTSQRVLRGRKTTAKATPTCKFSRRSRRNVAQTHEEPMEEHDEAQKSKETTNEKENLLPSVDQSEEPEMPKTADDTELDGQDEEAKDKPVNEEQFFQENTGKQQAEEMALECSSDLKDTEVVDDDTPKEETADVHPVEDVVTEKDNVPVDEQQTEGVTDTVPDGIEQDKVEKESKAEEEKMTKQSDSTEQFSDLLDKEDLTVAEKMEMTVDEATTEEPSAESKQRQDNKELRLQKSTVVLVDIAEVLPQLDLETGDTPGGDEKGETGEDQTTQTEEEKENVVPVERQDVDVKVTDSQLSQDEMETQESSDQTAQTEEDKDTNEETDDMMEQTEKQEETGTTTQESSDHDLGTDDAGESPTVEKRVLRRRTVVSTETPRGKSQRVSKKAVKESTAAPSDEKSEAAEEKMEEWKETAEETSEDEAPQTSQRVLRGRKTTAKATPRHKYSRRSKKNVQHTKSQEAEEEPEEENKPEEKDEVTESEEHPKGLEEADAGKQDVLEEDISTGKEESTENTAIEHLEERVDKEGTSALEEEAPVEESLPEETEAVKMQEATVVLVVLKESCPPSDIEIMNVEMTSEIENTETKADEVNLDEKEMQAVEDDAEHIKGIVSQPDVAKDAVTKTSQELDETEDSFSRNETASEIQSSSDEPKTYANEENQGDLEEEKPAEENEEEVTEKKAVDEAEISAHGGENDMAPISSDPDDTPTTQKEKPKRKRRAAKSKRRQSKRVRKQEEAADEEEAEEDNDVDTTEESDKAILQEPVSQEVEEETTEPTSESTKETEQTQEPLDDSEKLEQEQSIVDEEEVGGVDEDKVDEEELPPVMETRVLRSKTIAVRSTPSGSKATPEKPQDTEEATPDILPEATADVTEPEGKTEGEEGKDQQTDVTTSQNSETNEENDINLVLEEEENTGEEAPEREDSSGEEDEDVEEDVLVLRGRSITTTPQYKSPKRRKRAIQKEESDQETVKETPTDINTRERIAQGKKRAKVDVTPLRRSSRKTPAKFAS